MPIKSDSIIFLYILRILSILFVLFILFLQFFFVGVLEEPSTGGWTAAGFLYVFAPISTVVGVLILGLSSFLMLRKTKNREYLSPLYLGIIGPIILWIETFVMYLLPLGYPK